MKKEGELIRVFYYYSPRDEELGKQLSHQLGVLEREGKITSWYNEKLLGGDVTNEVLINALHSSDLILLLISSSFLNSEIWDLIERVAKERLLKKHAVRIIPVILRPCSWQQSSFLKKLNPLPCQQGESAVAVTSWANQDEAFAQVSDSISRFSEVLQHEKRRRKQLNLATYENALYSALKRERPLRTKTREKLSRLQKLLDLEDFEIAFSESLVDEKILSDSANEETYRDEVKVNIQEDRGEISLVSRLILDQKRELLGISEKVAQAIETEELKHPQKYERVFSAIYAIEYYLGESASHRLMLIAKKLGLDQTGMFEDIQNRILERLRISKEDLQLILNSKMIPQDLLVKTTNEVVESEANLDYSRLRLALEAQNWKAADQATHNVFLEFAKNHKWSRRISSDKLLNFPSLDLKTLDNLWQNYSDGHFGFSRQIEIYQQCGIRLNGKCEPEDWHQFGKRLGWANDRHWLYYFELTFDLSAPKGHLPGKIFSVVDGPLLLQIAHIANLEFS